MNKYTKNMKGFSEKEDYYMDYGVEGDEDYEQLQVQSRETRNIEQMDFFGGTIQQETPKRSKKRVLVVLLIIVLLLGLVTTSVLLFLEKTKTNENPLPTPFAINKFVSNPCENQISKTDKGNADLGSRGRSFLVSFIQNHNDGNTTNRTIIVSSKTDFEVTVSLPESQSSNLISISSHRSNTATFKKLNVHYSLVPSYSAIESKGIIINTSVTSSVLSLSEYRVSSDTTTVFPMDKLSTNYIISTAAPSDSYLGSGSHFTVASMKDNTLVSMVFAADHDTKLLLQGRSYGRGDTFNIILNKYQTFQIGHNADMTGTTISSSNPIAVFAGNRCNTVGYHGYCSMLMEMVPPTEKLDNVFIVPPNIHRFQSHIRIASTLKTDINFTTKETSTRTILLKNRFAEFLVREHEIGVIFSTKPVSVNSIAVSSTEAKIYGDTFMVTVPGINQYLSTYTNFVPGGYNFSFATFMIKNDSLRNLQINGTNINVESCLFNSSASIGKELYSVCTVSVPSGVINVQTSDGARFGFIVTGQRKHDGHAYTGNALLTSNCEPL